MKDVIVVGGGPVGLMTAALLDLCGVKVEVYERCAAGTREFRGTTMHPRTLEILTLLRASDGDRVSHQLIEKGNRVRFAHFANLPSFLDYQDLSTPFPFVLMLPQWQTEEALSRYLSTRDVPVHYGVEVTSVKQTVQSVLLEVRGGREYKAARYVVGADGARSMVRGAAGIPFHSSEPSIVGFVADVQMTQPAPRSVWNREAGYVGILPLADSVTRVFGVESHHSSLSREDVRRIRSEPFTLDKLRSALTRICGTDFGAHSPTWTSTASNPSGHAARYREGRILLAGDAAHVHLPAGGQGLNVGLQDANNLAWKLAAEIQGWAPTKLVGGEWSYDCERRPIAGMLVANTKAQDALMHTFTPGGEALREMFSGLIENHHDVASDLAGWLSGLGHRYPHPEGSHPVVGTRAPDLKFNGTSLLHELRPDKFVLLKFGSQDLGVHDHEKSVDSTRVVVINTPRPPNDQDAAWEDVEWALIRPDGYVAEASSSADNLVEGTAAWTRSSR